MTKLHSVHPKKGRGHFDLCLLVILIILLSCGLIILYSATRAREQRVSALRRVVRRVIVQRKVVRNGQGEAVSRKIDGLSAGDGRDALAVSVVCVQPQRNAAADDKTGDQRQNILNRRFFHASSFFKRRINQSYCKPGGINCQARGRREARPIRHVCSPCQFAPPCDTMNGLRRMQRGKKHGVLRV